MPRPEIQVGVDIKAQPMNEGQVEVVLDLNLNAKSGDTAVFVLELSYAGVFALANIPQDSLQPLLLIECPRLLFPFARRVVADVTGWGRGPAALDARSDRLRFSLYRHRLSQQQQQAGGQVGTPSHNRRPIAKPHLD